MTADNAPPADKIDVWRTVGAAYAFIFARPLRLLRLGGWWLALVALWQLWRLLPPPLQPPVIDENAPLSIMAAGFIASLFFAAGFLSFCVALHRAVLSGESRSWFAALRFGRREWRFLGYILLIATLMAVPVFVVDPGLASIIAELQGDAGVTVVLRVSFVIGYLEFLLVWIYGARLMLVFPAVAADETGGRLARAWQRGRGNTLRVYFGSALCVFPFAASERIALWILDLNRDGDVYGAISLATFILRIAVLVAFYAYCYRQLASAAPAADLAAPQAAPAE